jgi:hypothetical protein
MKPPAGLELARRHDLNSTSVDSLTAGAAPVTPLIQRVVLIFLPRALKRHPLPMTAGSTKPAQPPAKPESGRFARRRRIAKRALFFPVQRPHRVHHNAAQALRRLPLFGARVACRRVGPGMTA